MKRISKNQKMLIWLGLIVALAVIFYINRVDMIRGFNDGYNSIPK